MVEETELRIEASARRLPRDRQGDFRYQDDLIAV